MAKFKLDLTEALRIKDPREVPAYSIPEAAHYLRMPAGTLRSWVLGRDYPIRKGQESKRFKPLIALADPTRHLLSFVNLAETHVLSACRRTHKVPLQNIRRALDYISKKFKSDHPLIEQEFETDGIDLFYEHLGKLVDASARGQVMHDFVKQHLKRLERENAQVIRLYPFTRPTLAEDSPRSVFIDPRVSFGRPVLAKARIPTASIAERYLAGDAVDHLAQDYDCERLEIEEALRCELRIEAAA